MPAETLLRTYRATGDRAVRNRVVEDHMWLASTIAREFQRGSEPLADLTQVAAMALVKAADRFDPDYGSRRSRCFRGRSRSAAVPAS